MQRVRAELTAAGITDPVEQANVLAQIEAESALKPRSESLKYSGKRLYELFGPNQKRNKVRFKTLDEAKAAAAKGEEHIASLLYDGRKDLGNDKEGDGWKFRGRGFIQLTGKDNYRRYGKRIGVDLEANPDLANDPEIATKLAVAYFADKKKKGVDFKDPVALTRAVGPADPKAPQLRAELAKKYLDGGTQTPP
jgi:putative chitinase